MATLRDTPLPAAGNTAWYQHYQELDKAARRGTYDAFHLDEFDGTDDEKLTDAIAEQKLATDRNMPPIILPARPLTFTTPRQFYSGCKVIGPHKSGQKNGELSSGTFVGGPEISFGGSITNGASSWWHNAAGGQYYDVHMADFTLQGSQGAATHQFADNTTGNIYAGNFDAISGNFMRAMYGDHSNGRKFLATQVSWTGNNTWNNAWKCQMFLGGSDILINPDMLNIGVSQSAAQTGTLTTYFLVFDSIEATIQGKVYISTMNGWRGMLISGSSNIDMHGGIYEGVKPNVITPVLYGPGPGTQIKITGGAVVMTGTKIGQGMDSPDATEDGLVEISGSATEVTMLGVNFYGRNLGTANAIRHRDGRLAVFGTVKRTNESAYWTGRPKVSTTATAGTGTYTFSCPDQSVVTA